MKEHTIHSRIGVMSVVHEGRRPFGMQTYFFEDMVKSVTQLQEDIFFFSPLAWDGKQDLVSGYKFINQEWIEIEDRIPNVIYDRSFSSNENQKAKIDNCRQYLKAAEKTILNPFALADLLNNKVEFHAFLLEHGIPSLATYPVDVLSDENFFETLNGSQFYVKPTFGSKGQGIFVIEKGENGYRLFDNLGTAKTFKNYSALLFELTKLIGQDHYFIQEVANTELYDDAPFDIRVLVQNYGQDYKVTGKAVRIGQKSSKTSNLNSGGIAFPMEELNSFFREKYDIKVSDLQSDIENLCLACSEKLRSQIGEFCEIGFDILVTKDKGPIIIEGNAKPSRWVFVKIADYLENLGKDNTYYLDRRKETVSVPLKYASFLLSTKT